MSYVDVELLVSLCGGLGKFIYDEKGQRLYEKDPDCIACLKDVQRFLRRDESETREAFFQLGQCRVAQTDLVPMMIAYPEDHVIVFNALKVLTLMTMPVDPSSDNPVLQVKVMQDVKEAVLGQKEAIPLIVGLLAEPLEHHETRRMKQEDHLMAQLVLTFFRNLLCIPDEGSHILTAALKKSKTSLQASLLSRLVEEHVLELLLILCQHCDERPLKNEAPLLLDIFCEVFRGVEVDGLLAARWDFNKDEQQKKTGRATEAAKARIASVQKLRQQERQALQQAINAAGGPRRHANFRPSFVRRHGDAQVIIHGDYRKPELEKLPANNSVIKGATGQPFSDLPPQLLVQLRECLDDFVQKGGYNVLMGVLRRDLEPGLGLSTLDRIDFAKFLQLATFVTLYVRKKQERQVRSSSKDSSPTSQGSPYGGISATMGWETFHLVQVLWTGQIDIPTKSDDKDWEVLHCATALLKEMLYVLDLAQKFGTSTDRSAADRLQRRLLHDDMKESGLLPITARLMRSFSAKHEPRDHAVNLVEAVHVLLRMYDRLSQAEAGKFLVARRQHRAGRRRKNKEEPIEELEDGAETGEKGPAEEGISPQEEVPAGDVDVQLEEGGDEVEVVRLHRDKALLDELEDGDNDEEEPSRQMREVAYDLNKRIRQELAAPVIIQFYVKLLEGYSTLNNTFTNHCIASFLYRIILPEHLNLEAMLYQLSVLRVFHTLLSDSAIRPKKEYHELLHLATKVIRGLFAKLMPREDSDGKAPKPACQPQAQEIGDEEATRANGCLAGTRDAPDEAAGEAPTSGKDTEDTPHEKDPEEDGQHSAEKDRERKINRAISAMMFIELMFWKGPGTAEEIRNEYWLKKSKDAEGATRMGRGRRGRAADWDDDDDEGVRHKALLTPEKEERLKEVFELHASHKRYLPDIVAGLGTDLSPRQVAREMRRIGLKFGELTEAMALRLEVLYNQHKADPNYLDLIAGDLPGHFSPKQIKRLLQHHWIVMPPGHPQPLLEVDRDLLVRLYELYKEEDFPFDKIAAELYNEHDVLQATDLTVEATLRKHKIIARPDIAKDQPGGGSRRRINKKLLKELYDLYENDPDCLNLIAAELPGKLSADQVQKALRRYGMLAGSKGKGEVVTKEELLALYEQYKDEEDYLDRIGKELPDMLEGKKVMRLLKKFGIVKSKKRTRKVRTTPGARTGRKKTDEAGAGGAGRGLVPEPQPTQLLKYLTLVQRSHDPSSDDYSAQQMVDFLLERLDAAESQWRELGHNNDIALVPHPDTFSFYATDYSNDFLRAAGVRDDENDYFKIPGNSTQEWRDRVRGELQLALSKIDTEEGELALQLAQSDEAATNPSRNHVLVGAGEDYGDGRVDEVSDAGDSSSSNSSSSSSESSSSSDDSEESTSEKEEEMPHYSSDEEGDEEEPQAKPVKARMKDRKRASGAMAEEDEVMDNGDAPRNPPRQGRKKAGVAIADDDTEKEEEETGAAKQKNLSTMKDTSAPDVSMSQQRRALAEISRRRQMLMRVLDEDDVISANDAQKAEHTDHTPVASVGAQENDENVLARPSKKKRRLQKHIVEATSHQVDEDMGLEDF